MGGGAEHGRGGRVATRSKDNSVYSSGGYVTTLDTKEKQVTGKVPTFRDLANHADGANPFSPQSRRPSHFRPHLLDTLKGPPPL